MKTTGAEWNCFYKDSELWGGDIYHDDVLIHVDGAEVEDYDDLPDNSIVEIKSGYVVLGGDTEKDQSLETYFRLWKKKQDFLFLSVECPREKYEAVMAAIKAAGGKCRG